MAKKGVFTKADYIPYDEYMGLLQSLRNDRNYFDELYLVMAFSTALRVSDVLTLRWEDILGKTQVVHKQEKKTGKVRRLKFTPETMERIEYLYEHLGSPDEREYLFRGQKAGEHITAQRINQRLKVIRDKYHVSVTNFSSHTFRKTFGRYVWEANGCTDEALIKLCNIFKHSSTEITMRYLGLRDEEIDELFDSIKL